MFVDLKGVFSYGFISSTGSAMKSALDREINEVGYSNQLSWMLGGFTLLALIHTIVEIGLAAFGLIRCIFTGFRKEAKEYAAKHINATGLCLGAAIYWAPGIHQIASVVLWCIGPNSSLADSKVLTDMRTKDPIL